MPTPIRLTAGHLSISTELNDTVAAQDLKKRLPLKLTGYRSPVDYCCNVACGLFDPAQTQTGWKNGDISLAGGWLAIFFDGEQQSENYRGVMVVAHLKESQIEQIKKLPDSVKITIESENE
ncbi:MAG: cyclophilin-like fold protein [Erysipelotrichaceae bacterium]|nr:cyclophilin-like fold protein [Erysipelotrichaceae bacterium]